MLPRQSVYSLQKANHVVVPVLRGVYCGSTAGVLARGQVTVLLLYSTVRKYVNISSIQNVSHVLISIVHLENDTFIISQRDYSQQRQRITLSRS